MQSYVLVGQVASQVLSYHSTQAHLHWLSGGIVEVIFYGLLCKASLQALRARAVKATAGAGCLVVTMDKALVAVDSGLVAQETHEGVYLTPPPPACVIVSDDQLAMWAGHAADLARIGVTRLVFGRSQAALAFDVARQMAAARQ